jgi:Leucine-rich repeat (LRR) protein
MFLRIGGNSFQGQIPSWLSNLTSLTDLYLVNNNFSGNIPADLCKLSNLTRFDVMNNKLDGPVPPSLFNISSITILGLPMNQLTGSLPLDIGFKLPKLYALATYYNYFEGPIPASLSNASELQYLILRGNRYHGLIPRDIGIHGKLKFFSVGYNEVQTTKPTDWEFITSLTNCSNLTRIDLEQNNFSGVMPVSIANLSRKLEWLTIGTNHIAGTISWVGMFQNLTKLTLEDNIFTGTLPIDIGKLSSLESLDLSHNGFEGQIPQSIGNVTVLVHLSLSNNFLNNSIPPSLGKLSNIESMDLSCNLLTGQIPLEIFSIPSLTILLNLSRNALSGAIPTQIGHLKSLGTMDLSMNKLDGEIPEAIEGCVQLRFLYLQGNLLQEQIPKGLNTLGVLEKLDLSSNNLTGPIPKFLEGIRSLSYLNLSFNNLSGPVPDAGVFSNSTILSVTGNTMLCGGPPFLQLHSCPSIPSHKASPHRLHIFIFGAIGLFIFCVCSVTAYCFIKRRTTSTFVHHEYLFFNEEHERISYAELHKATGSFSPANLIGSGSSGKVYFGNLTFGENLAAVAIKVLDLGQQRASRSFLAECNALKRIHHRKLVKVITVCTGFDHNCNEFKALVLEYICNGSLDDWLHPDKMTNSKIRRNLSLMQRLNIALDVAEALEYLHDHIDPRIVHCDIKPSNILLDDDLVGHVTDFGLAKIMSSEAGRKNHPETEGSSFAVKGTIGYIPPGQ